ncbi:MAG: class F sortase [Longispora sp.]|nr:class F sortase [Longispora sp. (in: high G+C Gram-positive bacteria)]
MSQLVAPGATRSRAGRWLVGVFAVLLITAGSITIGLHGRQGSLTGPAASRSVSPTAGGDVVSPGTANSAPLALRIPAIDLSVPLMTLGLNADSTVEVPVNFQDAGWFRLGPPPGAVGSAVILGHVDSHQGPAVFFRLRFMRTGDTVEVSRSDGTVAHFVVDKVATYLKKEFPAELVYGSHGYSALQLVTCGGEYDPRSRSYLSNVVVYTKLVAITPAAAKAKPVNQE